MENLVQKRFVAGAGSPEESGIELTVRKFSAVPVSIGCYLHLKHVLSGNIIIPIGRNQISYQLIYVKVGGSFCEVQGGH